MVKKKSFGLFIRESRIKQGFGQRELAVKIGVAPSYLNDIEKEKRSAPKSIVIKKIAKLLKININTLNDLIVGKNEKEIIKKITKRGNQRDINVFSASLIDQKKHEFINNFQLESINNFSILKIKNNSVEILNEKISSNKKALSEDQFYIYCDSFDIQRHKQAMSYSLISCMSCNNYIKSIELNNLLISEPLIT